MSDVDDAGLRAAIGGDAEALAGLMRAEGPGVREGLQISAQWQNVLDADDVMQVTYLEAFLRIKQFVPGGPGAFRGWLRRIADNNLRDAIKELQRGKRPPPGRRMRTGYQAENSYELLDMLAATSTTPSRVVRKQEHCDLLQKALGRLPPDYKKAVEMYDLEAQAIGEVAKALGRSEGAVHMLRARAHDQLREILGVESDFFTKTA